MTPGRGLRLLVLAGVAAASDGLAALPGTDARASPSPLARDAHASGDLGLASRPPLAPADHAVFHYRPGRRPMGAPTRPRRPRAAADSAADAVSRATPAGERGSSPRAPLRPFRTDRPLLAPDPRTIERGRLQVEMGLVGYARSEDVIEFGEIVRDTLVASGDTTVLQSWRHGEWRARRSFVELAVPRIRLGLSPRVEVELFVAPYGWSRVEARAPGRTLAIARSRWFDAMGLSLKVNQGGNDADSSARAVALSWTSTGQASRHAFAFGLGYMLSERLPWDVEYRFLGRIEGTSGGALPATASVALGRRVSGRARAIAEWWTRNDLGGGGKLSTLGFGLSVPVARDIGVDAGARLGLTRYTSDLQAFAGCAFRR